MNTQFFQIVIAFLGGILSSLSEQLRSDISGGKVILDDQVLEIKKEIAGGSTIELIDATTQRIDGICSFDKDRLETGRAFVFDQIAIDYATDANSGLEGALAYNTAAPKELQNALFVLVQDGREVLRMPVKDLSNIHPGQKTSDEYAVLKSLRYLVDNRKIEMKIKFAPAVTLDNTKKHYIHVRLSGLQTAKKVSA
jgi:hypothetical protein